MMADINKTIKDIEECLSASCRGYKPKMYCPHSDEEWDIMRDALELLKEQQPKVIKLLDLYDSEGMQGYIETRKSIRPCFLVHHLQYPAWCYKSGTPGVYLHKMGIMDTSSLKRFWEFRLYNKTWRIWTAKPTDEQRKAVPWD